MDNTGPGTTAIHLVAGGTKCFRVFSQVVLTSAAMKVAKRTGDCIDRRFQRDMFTVCPPFATVKLGVTSRMTAQAGTDPQLVVGCLAWSAVPDHRRLDCG